MIQVVGDIWEHPADAICITTNLIVKNDGTLVMGAGLAKQAKDRYWNIARFWGDYFYDYNQARHKNVWSLCEPFEAPDGRTLVSFPTKYNWKDKSDLALILNAARWLVHEADNRQWNTVVLPRPGCGLGGLEWDKVKSVIEPILTDDRFHVISPK